MISNQIAHDKSLLGEKINKTFEEVTSLLSQLSPDKTMYIMSDWHAFKVFWAKNADLTKVSLEETKERHQQVIDLLEKAKQL
ncbi:hypothetical protein CON65_16000 [Bacillus pseudomycoides]|uniref:Uncharacterized protein n=1 Tax=Bacillus pseudomycoides TaxID=64104 RepID=A0AA91VAZ9_9BACI|nr:MULTISPECIES: hypothetical protein [Bacillus]PEB56259.1 hypothetical protein COO03_01435 [Bacillus sp. AFS098217]PED81689.1 hypothetical protein CON65_16000 [Bacillus pseudomycoides]